jgi:hypothetical protein
VVSALLIFSLNSYVVLISCVCCMPCPSHPPWFDHYNNAWRKVQIMELLILQSPLFTCYFLLQVNFSWFEPKWWFLSSENIICTYCELNPLQIINNHFALILPSHLRVDLPNYWGFPVKMLENSCSLWPSFNRPNMISEAPHPVIISMPLFCIKCIYSRFHKLRYVHAHIKPRTFDYEAEIITSTLCSCAMWDPIKSICRTCLWQGASEENGK